MAVFDDLPRQLLVAAAGLAAELDDRPQTIPGLPQVVASTGLEVADEDQGEVAPDSLAPFVVDPHLERFQEVAAAHRLAPRRHPDLEHDLRPLAGQVLEVLAHRRHPLDPDLLELVAGGGQEVVAGLPETADEVVALVVGADAQEDLTLGVGQEQVDVPVPALIALGQRRHCLLAGSFGLSLGVAFLGLARHRQDGQKH